MATSINTAEIPVTIVVSSTAASYTVPSDRYAVVRAQVSDTGSISVNGVLVLGAFTWSAINVNANVNRINQGAGALSGAMNVPLFNGSTNQCGTVSSTTIVNANIGGLNLSNGGAIFGNSTASETSNHTFKVPAGSTIAGAGSARYLIELYRIPGSAT